MKKAIIVEHLFEISIGNTNIRLWRSQPQAKLESSKEIEDLENKLREIRANSDSPTEFAEWVIDEIPNVAALQVKQGNQSFVIYVDWP